MLLCDGFKTGGGNVRLIIAGLGPIHFLPSRLKSGLVLLKIIFYFRDIQAREHLAFFHTIADVHGDRLDVT